MNPVIIIDTREPWPHPWMPCFGDKVQIERGTLETGDLALKGLEDTVAVERKTASDFLGVIGGNRERFERELKRSRHIGHFAIIVEGSMQAILQNARGTHPNAVIGTITAWTRRYCPILFCDSTQLAATVALRWLLQPFEETTRNTLLFRTLPISAHRHVKT